MKAARARALPVLDAAHAQVAQLRQGQLRGGAGGQHVERGVDSRTRVAMSAAG